MIDLFGKKFGQWEVIRNTSDKGKDYCICECSCGTIKDVKKVSLLYGGTNSCGCTKLKNIIGKKFNNLTVVSYGEKKNGHHFWYCICDCGTRKLINGTYLQRYEVLSCGCLNKKYKNIDKRTYITWQSMKERCCCKNHASYARYGMIGITVCSEWKDSYNNFVKDMGVRPNGMTLDRKDNSKGYSKDNCRWATDKEQANNKTNNRYIEYNGSIKTLSQWADSLGFSYSTLSTRINVLKWPIEKAFTTQLLR